MASFDCKCSKCEKIVEFAGISVEDLPKTHEKCGGVLTRLWQFSTKTRHTFQTVGSLADRQASKLSDDAKQHMLEEQKTKKDGYLPGYDYRHPIFSQKEYRP
jgi:hypothetical protein